MASHRPKRSISGAPQDPSYQSNSSPSYSSPSSYNPPSSHIPRGSFSSTSRSSPAPPAPPKVYDTKLVLATLKASSVPPVPTSTKITNYTLRTSYNFLDTRTPTILVPGLPACWTPPIVNPVLKPDTGVRFIDQNAHRSPDHPWLAACTALQNSPSPTLADIDIVICRNAIRKLYAFIIGAEQSFAFSVRVVGETVFFVRRETKGTSEAIEGFSGFSRGFTDNYTQWDWEAKGSTSHHRVAEYRFGGLKCLVRYEIDGYMPEKAGLSASRRRSDGRGVEEMLGGLNTGDDHHSNRTAKGGYKVLRKGRYMPSEAMFDVKTRTASRELNVQEWLPRAYFSQTPTLVRAHWTKVGYRDNFGGRFQRVLTDSLNLKGWEKQHQKELRKLETVLLDIISKTKEQGGRCEVERDGEGDLFILRSEGKMKEDEVLPRSMLKTLLPGIKDSSVQETEDSDDDSQTVWEPAEEEVRPESPKDFTACDIECGFCGHCDY